MSSHPPQPPQPAKHSGSKYLRDVPRNAEGKSDVYDVLEAFDVRCSGRQHAIKKLLCSGIRGKGNTVQDLTEARDALDRAIQMEVRRDAWSRNR